MTRRLPLLRHLVPFLVLALGIAAAEGVLAAPGDIDPTFGTGGTARIHTGFGDDFGNAMLPLAGDGCLVAGSTQEGGTGQIFVAQYLSNGALNSSFGTGGVSRLNPPPGQSGVGASCLTLQADGKIVVGGSVSSTPVVARFLSNGTPDSTFGTNGLVTLPGVYAAAIAGVAMQGSKIVIGGGFRAGTKYHFGLIRLNSNGSLDTTFDGDGIVSTPMLVESFARALLLQSDGKIVLAGNAANTSLKNEVAVVRYNADGTLDTGFDGDGKTTIAVGPGGSYVYALANQDTRLLVAGMTQSTSSGPFNALLIRYNANGTLDPTFGPASGTGILIQPVGAYDDAFRGVAVTYNSRGSVNGIIAAGSTAATSGNTSDVLVCRYLVTGALDTSFDGDGIVVTSTSSRQDQAYGMALLGSKILLVGYSGFGATDADVVLLRYVATGGALDTGLDGDGIRIHDIGDEYAGAASIGVAPDGKVVLTGTISTNPSRGVAARLTPGGAIDTSFGVNGIALFSLPGPGVSVRDHVMQSDGRLLLVGSARGSASSGMLMLRLLPDGALDPSFAAVGHREWSPGAGFCEVTGVALRPDGRSILVGYTGTSGGQAYVGRFDDAGAPDLAFGSNGQVLLQPGGYPASAEGVAIQPDGKLVIVGTTAPTGSSLRILVLRLTANGALDPTFGGSGFVTTDVSPQSDYGTSVEILGDGKIVVSGNQGVTSSASGTCILRFDSHGVPDPTLDGDGIRTQSSGTEKTSVYAVRSMPDGHFLMAGSVTSPGGSSYDQRVLNVRYDGAADPGWSGDGSVTLDFASPSDAASDLALVADGSVLVAGTGGGIVAVTRLAGAFSATGVGDLEPPQLANVGPAWPNPTPLGATLAYTLPAPSTTSAAVFDVAGRRVRLLRSEAVEPEGNRSIHWDGHDENGEEVGRGVYFIRLRAGDQVVARRVVVAR
ncbi:MAG TPA: T9SS type A sorting domain-containing protein [Candidatus Eisenbacteria bacterium]